MELKQSVINRFNLFYTDTNNCIEYNILNKDGYGLMQSYINKIKVRFLMHRVSYQLFYNKDLMSNSGLDTLPPENYSQLLKMANIINNPTKNIYGFGANGSDPHRLYKKILPLFWTFGGDVFDSSGNPVFNSVNNIEALKTYAQLSRTGIIETQRQIDSYFAQGKIAFVISGAWLMKKIENTNLGMQYGVALMPRYLDQGISF